MDEKKKKPKDPSSKASARFPFSPHVTQEAASQSETPPSSKDPVSRHLHSQADFELPEDAPRSSKTSVLPNEETGERERRLPCNFPGLMKILIPEKSFTPIALPVRVTNISATGAMVEVHDSSKLQRGVAVANRFFELNVAHPEIPTFRGTIAWSDTSRNMPLLGLSSFDYLEEFSKVVMADDSTHGIKGPPVLPPPELEPFPPRTNDPVVVIRGTAEEALEVVVKGDRKRFKAPVEEGRFEVQLELQQNAENHLSLRTRAGARKSRAVPIRIINEQGGVLPKRKYFDTRTRTTEDGLHLLDLEFCGNVEQAERILYRFSQLMAASTRISLTAELEAPGSFDKRLFDALKSEARLIADDTTNSRYATKMLNDML